MAATAHPGGSTALRSNALLLPTSVSHQFKADTTQMPHKQPFKLEHSPQKTGTFVASSPFH